MPHRHLPVVPDLQQLKHQAKDLLRAIRAGDPAAVAELRDFHPRPPDPPATRLADAQLVLARSYYAPSWTRLSQAVELVTAIWKNDIDTVRRRRSLRQPFRSFEDFIGASAPQQLRSGTETVHK